MKRSSQVGSIETLRRFFFGEEAVELAYLFGSRAGETAGPISDYDLAVLYRKSPAPWNIYETAHRLAALLQTDRVDLIDLSRAPIELKYAVIATGILLYERSTCVRVEFEANTLTIYGDYLPVLRRQKKDLLEGGSHEAGVQRYRKALGQTQRVLEEARAVSIQAER